MIVYFAINGTPGERWNPTQAEAKAKKAPFVDKKVAEDGREGICNLLNSVEFEAFSLGKGFGPPIIIENEPLTEEALEEVRQSNTPAAQAKAKELMRPGADYERDWTATEIADFILNRATVNEASNILGCIGTRFAELAKGARA